VTYDNGDLLRCRAIALSVGPQCWFGVVTFNLLTIQGLLEENMVE
jgi:hypothetical protein